MMYPAGGVIAFILMGIVLLLVYIT
ncbi:UNVERIFIED_CONTAM: hypothetical protein GTU68_064165 [Idotea baltica]|nr:hypothetical protein [Idotea baltica]